MKLFGIKENKYVYSDEDFEGDYDFFDLYNGRESLEYVGIRKTDKDTAEKACLAYLGDDFDDISAIDQALRIADAARERGWYDEEHFMWGKVERVICNAVFCDPNEAKEYAKEHRLKDFEVFEFRQEGRLKGVAQQ